LPYVQKATATRRKLIGQRIEVLLGLLPYGRLHGGELARSARRDPIDMNLQAIISVQSNRAATRVNLLEKARETAAWIGERYCPHGAMPENHPTCPDLIATSVALSAGAY
jgi:hypothetical protein